MTIILDWYYYYYKDLHGVIVHRDKPHDLSVVSVAHQINPRSIFFCYALESQECACCLLSFLHFHLIFFLYQRTNPPQRSVLFINLLGTRLTPRASMRDKAPSNGLLRSGEPTKFECASIDGTRTLGKHTFLAPVRTVPLFQSCKSAFCFRFFYVAAVKQKLACSEEIFTKESLFSVTLTAKARTHCWYSIVSSFVSLILSLDTVWRQISIWSNLVQFCKQDRHSFATAIGLSRKREIVI